MRTNYYRPQTKFAKVIFLHVSVILSMEGGVGEGYGGYPSMHCRWYPSMPCRSPGPQSEGKLRGLAGGLQAHTWGVSRLTPGGLQAHTWGDFQARTHGGLQAHTWGCLQAQTQGGLQAHTQGGVSQHALRQTPTPMDGYCRGRYASYWNAFLLKSKNRLNHYFRSHQVYERT